MKILRNILKIFDYVLYIENILPCFRVKMNILRYKMNKFLKIAKKLRGNSFLIFKSGAFKLE